MLKLAKSYPKDPKYVYKKMNRFMKPYNDIKIKENTENLKDLINRFYESWQNYWFQEGFNNQEDIKIFKIFED